MTQEFRAARTDVERLLSQRFHLLSLIITQRARGNAKLPRLYLPQESLAVYRKTTIRANSTA